MKVCGFAGRTDIPNPTKSLAVMAAVMNHAPDLDTRCICSRTGGLAIVDRASSVNSGLVGNADQSICLALSGHIANSDGSTISTGGHPTGRADASLIEKLSKSLIETLQQLDGVYSLVMYDKTTGSLTLASDRFGFMPLYYCRRDDLLVFASEVKAILQVLNSNEPDWSSFADFFYVGHMLGNRTLFRDIHVLNPGEVIVHAGGTSKHERYSDFTQAKALRREEVSTERVATLFSDAVQRRARKDTSNTVLLSGGLDSRLVLGALHAAGISPRTITLEHGAESGGADGRLGCLVAGSFGLEPELRPTRKNFVCSGAWLKTFYILDGMVPNLELFISEVHRELDPSLGVVWDGLALDVALGGAHQFRGDTETNLKHLIERRPVLRFFLRAILSARHFRLLDAGFLERLAAEAAKIPVSENQFLLFLLMNRTRRRIAVNPYQLYSTQVEPMTPAADSDFMNYIIRIPSELKLQRRLYIDVLRSNFPRLMSIPAISGGEMLSFDPERQDCKPVTLMQRIARTYNRSRRLLSEMHDSAPLVTRILEIRKFNRPFYNRRLLRILFVFYRRGIVILHPLFKMVCYLELWHLLFMDRDSTLRFNPDELGFKCPKEATGL